MIEFITNLISNPIFFSALVAVVVILGTVSVVLSLKFRANMALRNEFISIISHKFRTPLTSMKWFTENLISTEKDSFRKKDLTDINSLSDELLNLMNTLVELTDSEKSLKDVHKIETVSIHALILETTKNLNYKFGMKNLNLILQSTEENLMVNVDRARFQFVMHAVLDNAAIYTPSGGKVEVVVTSDEKNIHINVTDIGIGIPFGQLLSIFKEFHRAPNAAAFDTEGLGVSLFLAHRIIRRLKGKIKLYSEGEGKGSRVEIILPRA